MPAGEVRRADVEDLALTHERLHRLPDLVPGRGPVDVVHLEEIDRVRLHPAERLLARADDVQRREARLVRPVAHRPVHLRGEDDLLAPAAALREPPAEDLLGPAFALLPPVDVGGVEEVDPRLERAVHDRERVGFARLRSEVHRAETKSTDLETRSPEMHVVHGRRYYAASRGGVSASALVSSRDAGRCLAGVAPAFANLSLACRAPL